MKVSLTEVSEFSELSREEQDKWLLANRDQLIETCIAYINAEETISLAWDILNSTKGNKSLTERNRLASQVLQGVS